MARCVVPPSTTISPNTGAARIHTDAGPGKCRTWKMTVQIAGLENARPGK